MENKPIENIDYKAFEGKWYSLYSIPTLMDKNWKQTTETYTLKDDSSSGQVTSAQNCLRVSGISPDAVCVYHFDEAIS